MAVGSRVYLKRKLPPKEVVEGFRGLPASDVADCMNRLCALHHSIKLLSSPKKHLCGVALTIKARAGDNLMIHQALEMAGEGDVIIVDTGMGEPNSLIGEVIICNALHKKIEGFVFDAPIRDLDAIKDMDIPVYATGTTPGGPFKEGPGEINVPISCGNVAVNPGDIVLGDEDGVIVIPRQDAQAILEKAIPFSAADKEKMLKASNNTWDHSWVEKKLKELNFEIIDDVYQP